AITVQHPLRELIEVPSILEKDSDKIIPYILLLQPSEGFQHDYLIAASPAPVLQGDTAIGIEPPAIDRKSVKCSVRRNIEIEQSMWLQYSEHFIEAEPEELGMFEAGGTHAYVDRVVFKGKRIRIGDDYIHAFSFSEIDTNE